MKNIYVASNAQHGGSLFILMGIMDILIRKTPKIAFFKPIIPIDTCNDLDIEFIRSRYNITSSYEQCYGFDINHVEMMIAQNSLDELLEQLIQKHKYLEENYDFVVSLGIQKPILREAFDFDINIKIAQNFGSAYIDVLNAKELSVHEIVESLQIHSQMILNQKCFHFATFINRIDPSIYEVLKAQIQEPNIYFLEEIKELDTPTIGDIINSLDAKELLIQEEDRSKLIRQVKVAALSLDNFLDHIEDGDLVVVPADRSEILIALFCALHAKSFANISGIIIPFDMKIHPNILKLITALNEPSIPILSVATDTYTTVVNINASKARLRATDERKIALALGLFNSRVNIAEIESRIQLKPSPLMTPMMFEYQISYMAKSSKKSIVLPESEDDRILRATEILLRENLVNIILLGEEPTIHQRSMQLGLDISAATIIDPNKSEYLSLFTQQFYEMRKAKGLSLENAKDAMHNKTYFATMMVQTNLADAMVSGACHTTADTIRPALQIIKTQKDISIVSSLFFICLETQVLVYADCAVNENPNADELAQIALSTAKTAQAFGITPKVAMLSYSTGDSGSGEDVEKVKAATKIAKEKSPDLLLDGPMQYDAAIDKNVAKLKLPNSQVAGEANVFIFPDLNTGNNTYKAVQRSTGAIAIGPILQGLNKPVNDLSRGCSVADIVNTVAITAIQAGQLS